MIELSEEQKRAITYIKNNYTKQPVTVLTAWAGCGKSTTINALVKELNLFKKDIAYCAYTGCAALTLKKKGINAQTIHHLIYNTRKDKKTGKLFSILKKHLDNDYKLIIIDEGSFVDEKVMQDLLSFKIPIIMMGDEGQLPPPIGKMNKYILNPDVKLTKIFRQKDGNSIINFASNLRYGIFDYTFNDNNVKCFNELTLEMCLWADQILCATNKDKDNINTIIRKSLGFTDKIPQVGDKLICLKNNWKNLPLKGEQYELVNGMTVFIEKIIKVELYGDYNIMEAEISLEFDKNIIYKTFIDLNPFLGKKIQEIKELDIFDYGYACTIHKSQSSQWSKVLVYAKNSFGDKKKLFYTAATRAIDKLVWVN